jgi:predicted nucleic acid-binding protein
VKLLVDSWGWLVLEDSRDPLHKTVSGIYAEAAAAAGNVFSTNFILDETISLLFRRRPFREASRFTSGLLLSPFITIEQVTPARFQKAFDLRLRLRDKPNISFTDLTTMIVARELKVTDILTGDKHFRQVGLGFQIHPQISDRR